MADSKIFFSYSRDDSEFVLNLAKNLRKAGATIWLDQLDIKPGSRWDTSIEKALDSSSTLLVILSCSAVTSNNVLDEVSYALEENKKVVPVLLEDCDIPFRLRRLQYADFTEDHKTGIATLIKALSLDDNVALKLADVAIENPSEAKKVKQETIIHAKKAPDQKTVPSNQQSQSAPKPKPAPPPPNYVKPANSSGSKLLYIVAGIAVGGTVVVLLFIWLIAAFGDENYDSGDSFSEDITTNIDPIEPFNSGSSVEDIAWNTALSNNTLDGYFSYLYSYGKSAKYYQETYEHIHDFLPNTAYVQYGIEGVERYYDKYLYYFGDELSLPQVDDILTPRFNNVLYSNTKFSPRGVDVQPGQKLIARSVYIDDSGNVWVEVGFR